MTNNNVAMILDDLMASIASALPAKVAAPKQGKVIDLDSVDWYTASPALLKQAIRKSGDEAAAELQVKIDALRKEQREIYSTIARPVLEQVLKSQPLQDFTSTYAGEVLSFAEAARRAQTLYTRGVQNGKLDEAGQAALKAAGYVEYRVDGELRLLEPAQRAELDALEEYFGIFRSVPTASREAVALLQKHILGEGKTLDI